MQVHTSVGLARSKIEQHALRPRPFSGCRSGNNYSNRSRPEQNIIPTLACNKSPPPISLLPCSSPRSSSSNWLKMRCPVADSELLTKSLSWFQLLFTGGFVNISCVAGPSVKSPRAHGLHLQTGSGLIVLRTEHVGLSSSVLDRVTDYPLDLVDLIQGLRRCRAHNLVDTPLWKWSTSQYRNGR